MKKKKILEYIHQRQFYLTLLLCVVTISIVYIVSDQNKKASKEIVGLNETIVGSNDLEQTISGDLDESNDESQENKQEITIPNEKIIGDTANKVTEDNKKNNDKKEIEDLEQKEEKVINEQVKEEVKEVSTDCLKVNKENISFDKAKGIVLPVDGNIILGYSKEIPVYFKTLEQYKVNPALLIQANVGDNVRAISGGVVESISYCEDKGHVITLIHGDGFKSIYGQLKKDMNVKEGDIVKQGDIIGFVGKATRYYSLEGDHIYFKLLEKNEPINPLELIK